MQITRLGLVVVYVLLGGCAACGAGGAAGGTDTIAVATPVGNPEPPLVTLVSMLSRDGSVRSAFAVLGWAKVRPVPAAGCVVVEPEPLRVGRDESEVPDYSGGDPLCEEAAFVVPLAGETARRVPVDGFISPSGARYAYWLKEPDGERRLWVRDAEGDEPTFVYHDEDPGLVDWSPDERHMAVGGSPLPNHRGHRLTIVSTELGEVLYECPKAYDACWSPDGTEVAYWLSQVGSKQLTIWNLQTGDVIPLASDTGLAYGPRYSPDGGLLAFPVYRYTREPSDNGEVWVVSRSDGSAAKVYENAGHPEPLAWTTAGDACWLRRGPQRGGRIVLLDVQSDPPRVLLDIDTLVTAPADVPRLEAAEQAAGLVRAALSRVARANAAVADLCEDLAAPRREILQAAQELAALPAACPEAGLLPEQCRLYSEALQAKAADLPLAACRPRMDALARGLMLHWLKAQALPASVDELAEGLRNSPQRWVSPGLEPGQAHRIRYCVTLAGPPKPGQLLLECGPFGDRMVRVRWPEEGLINGRYRQSPPASVETLEP